ncbi:DUF6687 family protein [Burkholderia cepacia]|uniref:DUF6687 family protein n=1 Tax=Burkholderia cepacia TaxID=292 RepID=UPI00384DF995
MLAAGNRPATQIERHPERDLAVFRLPASAALRGRASPRYCGLSPIGFRNRARLSTRARVAHDDVAIHQRHEGWVTRVSQSPRPLRDLSMLVRVLEAAERGNGPRTWRYRS